MLIYNINKYNPEKKTNAISFVCLNKRMALINFYFNMLYKQCSANQPLALRITKYKFK